MAEGKEENQSVHTIKQQQEQVDQKKLVCYYCETQCEYSVFTCKSCPWFIVCCDCSDRSNEHIHINQQLATSIGQVSSDGDKKHCYSCGHKIQNCYSICRTCQQQNINFWICDICSDKNNYSHSRNHLLQTVIHFDTLKDGKLQTYSEQFDEDIQDFSIASDRQQLELPIIQCELHHKNSSIAHHLEDDDYPDSPLPRSNTNVETKCQIKNVVSRVRFQIDGLFSSADFNNEVVASKNILRPPKVQQQQGFSFTASQCSKSKQKDKQNKKYKQTDTHIFFGYRCDICEVEPIKRVKYHCGECQDFDVCFNCFESDDFNHEHEQQYFQKTDGKSIKQKAFERISYIRQSITKSSIHSNSRKLTRSKTQILNTFYARY